MPYIEKVLVLSTLHLDPDLIADEELDAEDLEFYFDDLRTVRHEVGYLCFIGRPSENDQSELDTILSTKPSWLRPLVANAIANGCDYINFDRDVALDEVLKQLQEDEIKSEEEGDDV